MLWNKNCDTNTIAINISSVIPYCSFSCRAIKCEASQIMFPSNKPMMTRGLPNGEFTPVDIWLVGQRQASLASIRVNGDSKNKKHHKHKETDSVQAKRGCDPFLFHLI